MPALFVGGLGFGMTMAPSIASATYGIRESDAGVGSAMVTTMQQIGGSLSVALLRTLAADSAENYLTSHLPPARTMAAQAAIHGYHTAFWAAAAIFLGGALLCGSLLPRRARPAAKTPRPQPDRYRTPWTRRAAPHARRDPRNNPTETRNP